jgi:nucleotide-binding universal stress UspA family protein
MASPLPVQRSGPPAPEPFAFGKIVCAVNGSRSSHDAVSQAVKLVGPLDALTFVAVTDARGMGPAGQATLSEAHAADAVEAARAAAHADGVEAAMSVVHAGDVLGAILEAADDAGLLVVGTRDESRVAGTLIGGTSSGALHSSHMSILVARGRPDLSFPGVVLVGTRGAADHDAAVVAATIAASHGTRVVLAHAGHSDPAVRQALAVQVVEVQKIVGREPVVVSVDGPPVDRLVDMASSIGAGLLVLGSRGKRGPQALTSVSERVAHRAACPVLVLRRRP